MENKKDAPKLTPKQAKFVKGIAEGKTKADAYRDSYETDGNPNTVSVEASRTLKLPHVQEALIAEFEKQGITPHAIIAPVAKALKAKKTFYIEGVKIESDDDDIDLQLKGHDRAMKIISPRSDAGANISINFNQHVSEKREEYGI